MVNPYRFYTYAYLRVDRTPYYIGKGQRERVYQQKGKPCPVPKYKSRIILLKQNLTEEDAFKHEKYMIAVFGRKDMGTGILRNKTDGGEGSSGAIRSEETRRKISEVQKGKSISEETRKKQSEANKGRKRSEETKRRMSVSAKGRTLSEKTRKKLSEKNTGKNNPNYGKPRSFQTRKKIGDRNKNKRWWNDGNGNTKFTEKCPGEGWGSGRGKNNHNYGKKWWNDGKGNSKMSVECPGEGWFPGRRKSKDT